MTRVEFAEGIAYLEAGCGVPMPAKAIEVYFDILGDLPRDAFRVACKRVILEHPWKTFPSIAELRQAASETLRGEICVMSPGEAWAQAWAIVGRIDPEISGSVGRGLEGAHPLVKEAMEAMGIPALCYGKEPVGVLRGQFMRIYEQMAARDKRTALLPKSLQQEVKAIPGAVAGKLKTIGRME